MDDSLEIKNLKKRSNDLRVRVLDLALKEGGSHIGGSFSEIEILVSLYDEILKPEDKFILSKGHACFPYFLLLREKGYNPKIAGHPDMDPENGILCTTGSLGHGLPIGAGMALARKIKGTPGKIYVLMSDGECQEGTTWETSDILSKHSLDNLVAIVDYNKIQALDWVCDVSYTNLENKFKAFGWEVTRIAGHNFEEIIPALKKNVKGAPHMILADTIKGKGVSYMENNPQWHGRKVNPERVAKAYEELK